MDKSLRWKLLLVAVFVIGAVYFLYPSYKLYFQLTPEDVEAMPLTEQQELRENSIRLGLDLQGGMDLLLEVDTQALEATGEEVDMNQVMERALSVLRNRVDEFGVTEPVIQKSGDDRITVQLPGLTDPERARQIVQRVARLEFRLMKEPQEIAHILERLDRRVALMHRGIQADVDSTALDTLLIENPILRRYIPVSQSDIAFDINDVPIIEKDLADVGADTLLATAQLFWGKGEELMRDGREVKFLYILDRKVQLSGEGIKRASTRVDPTTGRAEVNLRFDTRSAATFARVTGNNVGRRLAIVLDDKVASAPVIQNRISGGQAVIQGAFTDQEANDLKVVLEAGALPVPLRIIEQRTVGPSLGRDSIRAGVKAAWVGGVFVIIFMVIYYRASGFVAVLALFLNLLFLLAALAKLNATLTLPGIAGVVLTIGMAVDANVLIFERIREELRRGQTVRVSVERGFEHAFTAILDANITTLIAAVVLLQFGTGPIRGFAVTLSIGIVANLFTAYFVSRMIFEAVAARRRVETAKMSI